MTEVTADKPPLILPSLRAQMGDWIYYIAFMKMKDLAQRVESAKMFYSSERLAELLQRQILAGRAKEIEHYLLAQKQRFFNALVIGTFGGNPQWNEMTIERYSTTVPKSPGSLEGVMGFLVFDGSEKLFTIDGQHRVEGIRLAVKSQPKLAAEDVCVILVHGVIGGNRKLDPKGYERTRRLFTTLNRYAKPVSKKDIITLDEDDAVAIITRRLLEEYPLFTGKKTSIAAATSISPSDKQSLTSINALYDGLDLFLIEGSKSAWKKFKRYNPGEPKIEELHKRSIELWNEFCMHYSPMKEIKEGGSDAEIAGKYRTVNGGNVLFRPIGLLMFIKVIRQLMDHNELTLKQAFERILGVPMELSADPWADLIWNPRSKKIITSSPNRKAAEKLLFHAVGGDLVIMKSSQEKLRKELADIKGVPEGEVILPSYARL